MIIDSEKAIDKVFYHSDEMDVKDKFDILSKIMYNASIININDIKTLTKLDIDHYYDVLKYCYDVFERIMRRIISNVIVLKFKAYPEDKKEDLTELSKEELIELLLKDNI